MLVQATTNLFKDNNHAHKGSLEEKEQKFTP